MRCEPALVRQARLFIGQDDPALEADLWFSSLVESRSTRGIVLLPEVAAELRAQLARRDLPRFEQARALVATLHAAEPWSLRAEESLYHLSARSAPGDPERCEAILQSVGARLRTHQNPKDLARWILRALDRMPPEVLTQHAARALSLGAGVQLDRRVPPTDPGDLAQWTSWLPQDLPSTPLHVRRQDAFLDLAAHPLPGGLEFPVPQTDPLVVDVVWHDGVRDHLERVRLRPGQSRRLHLPSPNAELRTLLGQRQALIPTRTADTDLVPGFDFAALRARHRPFHARQEEFAELQKRARFAPDTCLALTGPPGVGKTALLCRLLDALAADRAPVAVHFLADGPPQWSRTKVLQASLRQQLEALLPPNSALESDTPDLHDLLLQVSRSSEHHTAPILLIDGLHAAEDVHQLIDWLAPNRPPAATLVVSTRDAGPLAALRPVEIPVRPDAAVCRAYLEHYARATDLRTLLRSPGPGRVFVAHDSQTDAQRTFATDFARALQRRGVKTFLDLLNLKPGDSFQQAIEKTVSASDTVVALLSEGPRQNYALSQAVEMAAHRGLRILPVALGVGAAAAMGPLRERQPILLDPSFGPELAAERVVAQWKAGQMDPIRVLLDHAAGVCGRLVAMLDWLTAQPPHARQLDRLPPTLYDGFHPTWQRLAELPELTPELRDRLMALLAAAREPLPRALLERLLKPASEPRPAKSQFPLTETPAPPAPLAPALQTLVRAALLHEVTMDQIPDEAAHDGPWFELSHPSIPPAVREALGPEPLRQAHRDLASLRLQNSLERRGTAYRYGLRHEIAHHTAAGDLPTALSTATDLGFLNEIRHVLGSQAVLDVLVDFQQALDQAAATAAETAQLQAAEHGLPVQSTSTEVSHDFVPLLRDLLARFPALPPDLTPALYHGLRERGWNDERLTTAFGRVWDKVELAPVLRITSRTEPTVDERWPATAWTRLPSGRYCGGDSQGSLHLLEPGDSHGSTLSAYGSPICSLGPVDPSNPGIEDVLVGYENGHVVRHRLPEGAPVWDIEPHAGPVTGLLPLPDRHAASWSKDGTVSVFNTRTGQVRTQLVGSGGPITAFVAHGATLEGVTETAGFTASSDGTLRRWDLRSGRLLDRVVAHHGGVRCLALHPSSRFVLTADDAGILRLWEVDRSPSSHLGLREIAQRVGHRGAIHACGFLDPQTAISTGADGTVRIWDFTAEIVHPGNVTASPSTPAGKELLHVHRGPATGFIADPKGGLLTFASDGSAQRWTPTLEPGPGFAIDTPIIAAFHDTLQQSFWVGTSDGRLVRVSEDADDAHAPPAPVESCAILPHADVLFSTRVGETFRTVLADRSPTGSRRILEGGLCTAPAAGDFFVTATSTQLRVYHPNGELAASHGLGRAPDAGPPSGSISALAVSPSGRWIATGHAPGTVVLWYHETAEGHLRQVALLPAARGAITSLAFTPREDLVAATSQDGTATLWRFPDAPNVADVPTIPRHRFNPAAGPLLACALAPEASLLATGGFDRALRLWDLRTGSPHAVLSGHREAIRALAFTPDGHRLLSASEDATLRLWDPASLTLLETCHGPSGFHSLAVASDSRTLAAGEANGSVWLLVLRPPPQGSVDSMRQPASSPQSALP